MVLSIDWPHCILYLSFESLSSKLQIASNLRGNTNNLLLQTT